QADPQGGWGEGDPGDEGQVAEALFRLRGGAQGCRQWRPGGARSVDQTGSRSSRVALSRSYAAPPSTRMTAPVVKLDARLARQTAAPTIPAGSPPRWRASGAWALRRKAARSHASLMSVKHGPAWSAGTPPRG